jgi:plasmid maintenance system antidote protein VapI
LTKNFFAVILSLQKEVSLMDNIGERTEQVLKAVGVKKVEAARRLNVSSAHITKICKGESGVSDRTISDICREFGVNEIWLRTGAGEMFRPEEESEELSRNLKRLMNGRPDSLARRAVRVLLRYEPDGPEWQVLEKIYNDVLAEAEKKEPES